MKKNCLSSVVAVAILLLTACSEPTKTASTDTTSAAASKEPEKPAGPMTGKTAYWEMYTSARGWSKDIMPLSLVANEVPGIKNEDGKAGMWTAIFASPSMQQARTYTYAIAAHPPDIYTGVVIGAAVPWSGPTQAVVPFQMGEVSLDSDAAFKAGSVKAADWIKKNPNNSAAVSLSDSTRFPSPVWTFFWGTKKNGYIAFVNATSGQIMTGK
jgi:hypothetical protein